MTKESACFYCKNFIGKVKDKQEYECKAFKIIPHDILFGRFVHDKPFPGDNGIQYEKTDIIITIVEDRKD